MISWNLDRNSMLLDYLWVEIWFGLVSSTSLTGLAGSTLISLVVNHWWPSFPSNLSNEVYYEQFKPDQWSLRVAHHLPWLTYWWNTQKWFPSSSVASQSHDMFSPLTWKFCQSFLLPQNKKRRCQDNKENKCIDARSIRCCHRFQAIN